MTGDDATSLRNGKKLFGHPYLLLTLPALFWGGNMVVGRAASGLVPPMALVFWRYALGALLALAVTWPFVRREWPEIRRHWGMLALLALVGVVIFPAFAYIALQYTTALNAVLMQTTAPVFVIAWSFVLYRERIGWRQAAGVLVSLGGALVIVTQGKLGSIGRLDLNVGDLWMLAAIICYAAYSALLRSRPPLSQQSFLAITFGLSVLILLPFYLAELLAGRTIRLTPGALLAIGYVALFPSLLAYLFFNRGVELVGANRAAPFFHLIPVFGSLLAIVFLGERFEPFHAAGIALIVGGIALATLKRSRTSVQH